MSLFSSEEVFTIHITTVRLMEGDSPGKSSLLKEAVLKAVYQNGDIPEYLMDAYRSGLFMAQQVKKYFKYGKDHYVHKLPTTTATGGKVDEPAVQAILNDIYAGYKVEILQITLNTPPDLFFFGLEYLFWNFDLNVDTRYTPDSFYYEGTTSEPVYDAYDRLTDQQRIFIHYSLQDQSYETDEKTYWSYDATHLYHADTHYQITYKVLGYDPYDYHKKYVLHHRLSTTPYDSLKQTPEELETQLLPIAMIRYNFKDIATSAPHLLESTDALLEKIDTNTGFLNEAINGNPDQDKVKYAFVYFGLSIYSENQSCLSYLSFYFWNLKDNEIITREQWAAQIGQGLVPTIHQIEVKEHDFYSYIEYNWIERGTSPGLCVENAKVGQFYRVFDIQYDEVVGGNEDYEGDYQFGTTINMSSIILAYQETPNQFLWVQVHGLTHTNVVVGTEAKYNSRTYSLQNPALIDPNHEEWIAVAAGFLIPIDYAIFDAFDTLTQNEICYYAMSLVIYSENKTTLAWYQNSFFAPLIQVASLFGGAYFGLTAAYANLVGAGVAGSSALATVLTKVAIGQVVSIATKKLLADGNLIAAIALNIAAGVYSAGGITGIKSMFMNGLPSAGQLMTLGSAVMDIYGLINTHELQSLQKEYAELEKDAKEKEEELQRAWDYLQEDEDDIDPLFVLRRESDIQIEESPEAFFNRTIHTPNPGVLALDSISNYVDSQLDLSLIDDKLEDDWV